MKILILGISGSIGSQVLDVLSSFKNYEIVGFSLGFRNFFVDEYIKKFSIKSISLNDEEVYKKLQKSYPSINFYCGEKNIEEMIKHTDFDICINALSGFRGFLPSVEVLKKNKTLLLANKESLVVGGEIINKLLKDGYGKLIPIDSEHVAVAKCLENENMQEIRDIFITASGGPFLNLSRNKLEKITPEEALNHPNWKMGKRITIDSSTMVNKCFELIEAHYLFNFPSKHIKAIIEKTSHIHGFVIFKDGRIKINYSTPSMKNPIKYALDKAFGNKIDLSDTFFVESLEKYNLIDIDRERFPAINLANKVIEEKGDLGALLNALDERLVFYFLNNKIKYIDIDRILVKIFNNYHFKKEVNINELILTNNNSIKAIDYLVNKGKINE